MENNNLELILEKKQSQFILFNKEDLYHLLKDKNNLQEVLEVLDSTIVPVSSFNDGLLSKEDKSYIEYLKTHASDRIYVYDILSTGSTEPVTKIRVDSRSGLKILRDGDVVTIGVEEHLKKVLTDKGNISIDSDSSLFLASDGLIDIEPNNESQAISFNTERIEDFAIEQALVFG